MTAVHWHMRAEIFSLGTTVDGCSALNVAAAKAVIATRSRRTTRFSVGSVAGLLDRIRIRWQLVRGDLRRSDAEIDLSIPIIVATWGSRSLPIDGWHRIAKASLLGIDELPAVRLTTRETRGIAMPNVDDAFARSA